MTELELEQVVEQLVRQARPAVEAKLRADFRSLLDGGKWVVINNTLMTGEEALKELRRKVA